jgi:hypothetical protein
MTWAPVWRWTPRSALCHWYPDGAHAACDGTAFIGTPAAVQRPSLDAPSPVHCPRCWDAWRATVWPERLEAGPAPRRLEEIHL